VQLDSSFGYLKHVARTFGRNIFAISTTRFFFYLFPSSWMYLKPVSF
jgi:hypothetical protein